MCGRYSAILGPGDFDEHPVDLDPQALREFFESWKPRYNLAPTQVAPVALSREELVLAEWGLRPKWMASGAPLVNARGETAAKKFRAAFERFRVLVLADGFYEWHRTSGGKTPYRFTLKIGRPFAFGGIAERVKEAGGARRVRFAILTTASNELVRSVHDRMPLILPKEAHATWLAGDAEDAEAAIAPFPADEMAKYRVSTAVNSWKNDTPEVVQPVE